MNRNILGLVVIFFLVSLACGKVTPPMSIQPEVETIVAATFQALTASPPPTQAALSGTLVSVNNISFTIPTEIGSGARVETIAAVSSSDDMPWWGIAPTYHKYIIQGYPLSGTFHTQTIYVYPINEYLQVNAEIAELFDGLKTILDSPSQPLPDNLPFLPAFNAGQMFHSNELTLKFQNGEGIRFLTQYGQAPYPVNNDGLFYTFQGVTDDGMYYVAAILPINASFLPADGNPDTPPPADGIPFDWENFENMPQYFEQARQKLNSTDANTFTPVLTKLDELIQSIMIK